MKLYLCKCDDDLQFGSEWMLACDYGDFDDLDQACDWLIENSDPSLDFSYEMRGEKIYEHDAGKIVRVYELRD